MKALSRFLNRIASWKTLALFLIMYLLFPAWLLKHAEAHINELSGKTVGIIDLTFGFDPQRTLQMVADYGAEARSYYAFTEMTTDIAYPVVYAFLFGIVLSLLYRKSSFGWVNVIPFITMLFDFAENIHIVLLLKNFPQQSGNIAVMLEAVKLLKWISFGAIICLIVAGIVMKLVHRNKSAAVH